MRLAIAYQNERLRGRVERLTQNLKDVVLIPCDVTKDAEIENLYGILKNEFGNIHCLVHSVAYAQREDLGGEFSKTSRIGFKTAMEISAFSLIPLVRHVSDLMPTGGSIITMTFQASARVFPGYNIMGTAKAALENEVRQLAAEYGKRNIRINAISAGPLETLAARGISGFLDMRRIHKEKAPLGRNITHEEVGKTALYLCSDLSSGVTGTIIPVDAGYHIMAI